MRARRASVRLRELLVEQAIAGLSRRREAELEQLLDAWGERERATYERAAAAAHLAIISNDLLPLPAERRRRIQRHTLERLNQVEASQRKGG